MWQCLRVFRRYELRQSKAAAAATATTPTIHIYTKIHSHTNTNAQHTEIEQKGKDGRRRIKKKLEPALAIDSLHFFFKKSVFSTFLFCFYWEGKKNNSNLLSGHSFLFSNNDNFILSFLHFSSSNCVRHRKKLRSLSFALVLYQLVSISISCYCVLILSPYTIYCCVFGTRWVFFFSSSSAVYLYAALCCCCCCLYSRHPSVGRYISNVYIFCISIHLSVSFCHCFAPSLSHSSLFTDSRSRSIHAPVHLFPYTHRSI